MCTICGADWHLAVVDLDADCSRSITLKRSSWGFSQYLINRKVWAGVDEIASANLQACFGEGGGGGRVGHRQLLQQRTDTDSYLS